jgi:hypothetical protein
MAAGDGLVSMKPTSIAHSGTSASINADGGVDFTAVTSLSLNGVFTSEMDNYLVVWNGSMNVAIITLLKLRAAGTDTTANYNYQQLLVDGTTRSGSRATGDPYALVADSGTTTSGETMHFYGPYLAQPTAIRTVSASSRNTARIVDHAITQSDSTQFDGFTLVPNSSREMTGTVHVFGYEE